MFVFCLFKKKVLEILQDNRFQFEATNGNKSRATCVLVVAGHDHDGGQSVDARGILHKTFVSPLICKNDQNAFATVKLYGNRIEVRFFFCILYFVDVYLFVFVIDPFLFYDKKRKQD